MGLFLEWAWCCGINSTRLNPALTLSTFCDLWPVKCMLLWCIVCWQDHKPDSVCERARIERCGGEVTVKAGVSRVVWKRPRESPGFRRHSITRTESIPFLAIARSLGQYSRLISSLSVTQCLVCTDCQHCILWPAGVTAYHDNIQFYTIIRM